MSQARLVITAVVVEGRSQSDVARKPGPRHSGFAYQLAVKKNVYLAVKKNGSISANFHLSRS
jgi:hypothetical protein